MAAEHDDGMEPLRARQAVAEALARGAGARARKFFLQRDTLHPELKSDSQDLVSEADRSIEAWLRRAIRRHFPGDGIVGEEEAATEGTSGFVWVIDPIDGTMPFLVGQPNWTVSIGLACGGEPVAGVIYAPMLRELYSAVAGGGARLNGRSLAMNPDWTIASTTIGFGATQKALPAEVGAFVEGLYREGGVLFRVGSGALMLAYVAANRLAGYYDPTLHCWDCWAGMVLVREAGGLVSFDGDFTRPGAMWAGNATVHAALRRLSGRD
ncbi:myo-inositol-1(or 4)-monophosphatase [Ancylobacter vacuolatus]|uniref:Myo-inositol-1(Or 4)-monophosphatase n=2 Tax=Ancylobacter vacuolatus TaxID=223389 RepID=A0ABU0DHU1_9HYPH|nr:inositol monophosphatase [Ancylobacter vacuolatus]MDQ0348002.1 myo-inositol-1(or 4)-monophosphatase [Ancylobacter vacuolatus]